jgi:hypothetical protein
MLWRSSIKKKPYKKVGCFFDIYYKSPIYKFFAAASAALISGYAAGDAVSIG